MKRFLSYGLWAALVLALMLCGCQKTEVPPEAPPAEVPPVQEAAPEPLEAFAGLCGRVWAQTSQGVPYTLGWDTTWPVEVPSFVIGEGGRLFFQAEKIETVPGIQTEWPDPLAGLGLFSSTARSIAVQGQGDTGAHVSVRDGAGRWTETELDPGFPVIWTCCGFRTEDEGWAVLCGGTGMGNQPHALYKTHDGGASWEETETNLDEIWPRVLTGGGFVSEDVGFLGFRYDLLESRPALLMTLDGGRTWSLTEVDLPEDPAGWNITPLSPCWDGTRYVLTFLYSQGEEEKTVDLPLEAGTLLETIRPVAGSHTALPS